MKKRIRNPYSYFYFRLSNTLSPEGSVIHSHITGLMLLHHFTAIFIIGVLLKYPIINLLWEAPPIIDVGIDQLNLFVFAGLELGFFQIWYRLNGKSEGIRKKFENETEKEKHRGTLFNIMLVFSTVVFFCLTLLLYFFEFLQ